MLQEGELEMRGITNNQRKRRREKTKVSGDSSWQIQLPF
jgi:hypothetical protein